MLRGFPTRHAWPRAVAPPDSDHDDVVPLSQHRLCSWQEAVRIQAPLAVFAPPRVYGPRTTRGRLAARAAKTEEVKPDLAKDEEEQALSQTVSAVIARPEAPVARVYGPRTTRGRLLARQRLASACKAEDEGEEGYRHCFFLPDAEPQQQPGKRRKRGDPAALCLAKQARCSCDAAMVAVQLLDHAPDAAQGSQAPSVAGARLCTLVEQFLVDSGCLDAACFLLLGKEKRPGATVVCDWTVDLATEYLLTARLRFARVVAGWRAFFCSGVDGPALLALPAVRRVMRFNLTLSRLDPHLPRPTRRVAAQLLGLLVEGCRFKDAWLGARLARAATIATGHCAALLRNTDGRAETGSRMVAATIEAVLLVSHGIARADDLLFLRTWCRLQDFLADRDMKGVPFVHKADGAFDEMYFVDPETLGVHYLRPVFPKNKATGLEVREAVEKALID